MKKFLKLNDNHVDVNHVSFISKTDTQVLAHINRVIHFFTLVVAGKEIKIEADTKKEIDNLRNQLLYELELDIPTEFRGLVPS